MILANGYISDISIPKNLLENCFSYSRKGLPVLENWAVNFFKKKNEYFTTSIYLRILDLLGRICEEPGELLCGFGNKSNSTAVARTRGPHL